MKIFHISDLHIGKLLNTIDILDLQEDVFDQIIKLAKSEAPDVIIMAGDIYDKSVPSGEALKTFENFLGDISVELPNVTTLVISGNHDNALRLGYGSSFFEKHNIFISVDLPKSEEDHIKKIVLEDSYGKVNFYLLPFVRLADAKNMFKDRDIDNYDEAVAAFIERENIDYTERNVLVSHQFYVHGDDTPERRESELSFITVGGIDAVDVRRVKDFDYVALGHIHSSQSIGYDHIRYSGTPLKYSVSEANDTKTITVLELKDKGQPVDFAYKELNMRRDIVKLRGTLAEVLAMADDKLRDDYVSITLTDFSKCFRPKDQLEEVYNNILELKGSDRSFDFDLEFGEEFGENDNPMSLFEEFYREINGEDISEEKMNIFAEVLNSVKERFE